MEGAKGKVGGVEIGLDRILTMIPHREPFLMIDRVIDAVPGKSAVGVKAVSIDEDYFRGHFPRRPLMPGVIIIETMAQTAAVLVVHTLGAGAEGKLVYFMSVEKARFRRPVLPGDTLHVRVECQRHRGAVWKFAGKATVGDKVVADAIFTAMIVDD
jgi:3-hydroxyacyl-[acyl-carrier-protein] dehydratase